MPEPKKPKKDKNKKIDLNEFDEIEADVAELEAHFGDLGLDGDDAANQQRNLLFSKRYLCG